MLNLGDYAVLGLYAVIGFLFVSVTLGLSSFFQEKGKDPERGSVYECGMKAIGTPYVAPNIRFYVFALVFVIFDLESIFVLPWAVRFKQLGFPGLVEMLIFIAVLFVAFIVAWRKGALRWE